MLQSLGYRLQKATEINKGLRFTSKTKIQNNYECDTNVRYVQCALPCVIHVSPTVYRRWKCVICEVNHSFPLPVHLTVSHHSWQSSSQFSPLTALLVFLTHPPSFCFPVLLSFYQPIFHSLSCCFFSLCTHTCTHTHMRAHTHTLTH